MCLVDICADIDAARDSSVSKCDKQRWKPVFTKDEDILETMCVGGLASLPLAITVLA